MRSASQATGNVTLAAVLVAMIINVQSIASAVAQTISPAPLTVAQADAGRNSYMTNCASCHGDDLAGNGAPALAGKGFAASQIGQLTAAQLYTYIQETMPYGQSSTLTSETYVNILAFIMEENGAKPGDQPLTPSTNVIVGDIITGIPPANFVANPK